MSRLLIYCCGCKCEINARLITGAELYPHKRDLMCIPFWKCDQCRNYVGCHYKTRCPTRPLGCIPTPEIRSARMMLHNLIDPIWKSGRMSRSALYRALSVELGRSAHIGHTRSVEEVRELFNLALKYAHSKGR